LTNDTDIRPCPSHRYSAIPTEAELPRDENADEAPAGRASQAWPAAGPERASFVVGRAQLSSTSCARPVSFFVISSLFLRCARADATSRQMPGKCRLWLHRINFPKISLSRAQDGEAVGLARAVERR